MIKLLFTFCSILAQRLVRELKLCKNSHKKFQVAWGKPVGFNGIPIFHTFLGTKNWFKFQMWGKKEEMDEGSDDVTKTRFVKLCDWLAYPKEKMKKVHLPEISLLVQIGEEI